MQSPLPTHRFLREFHRGTGIKMSANECAKFLSGKIFVFAKRAEFMEHFKKTILHTAYVSVRDDAKEEEASPDKTAEKAAKKAAKQAAKKATGKAKKEEPVLETADSEIPF